MLITLGGLKRGLKRGLRRLQYYCRYLKLLIHSYKKKLNPIGYGNWFMFFWVLSLSKQFVRLLSDCGYFVLLFSDFADFAVFCRILLYFAVFLDCFAIHHQMPV